LHSSGIAVALVTLGAAVFSLPSYAAKLAPADRAWIDTCISQRKARHEKPARLRKYCTCMEETIDDNQPFGDVTSLERAYPPAHLMCWKDARRRSP
jgi:hypothetical protein